MFNKTACTSGGLFDGGALLVSPRIYKAPPRVKANMQPNKPARRLLYSEIRTWLGWMHQQQSSTVQRVFLLIPLIMIGPVSLVQFCQQYFSCFFAFIVNYMLAHLASV